MRAILAALTASLTIGLPLCPGARGQPASKPYEAKTHDAVLDRVVQGKWGSKPKEFGLREEEGSFGPAGFAVPENGWLYVLDRQNRRFQVFDATGRFVKACTFEGPGLLTVFCVAPNGSILASQGWGGSIALSSGGRLAAMPKGDMQSTQIYRMRADRCRRLYLEERGREPEAIVRRYSVHPQVWMRYEATFFGGGLVSIPFSCDIAVVKGIRETAQGAVLSVERIRPDLRRRSAVELTVPPDPRLERSNSAPMRHLVLVGADAYGRLYVLDRAWFVEERRYQARVLRYTPAGRLEDIFNLQQPKWWYCELGGDLVQVDSFGTIYVAEADANGYRISRIRGSRPPPYIPGQ